MTTSLRGFGQFIAYLPHQFGFVPDRSFIVTGFRDGRVTWVLRFDDDITGLPVDAAAAVRSALASASATVEPDSIAVTAYRVALGADHAPLVSWIEQGFAPVTHAFTVCGDVWWAERCELGCCDGALHEVERFDALGQGLPVGRTPHPAPSRKAAAQALRHVDTARAEAVACRLAELEEVDRASVLRAWEQLVQRRDATDLELARLSAALADPDLRDRFAWSVVPEVAPPPDIAALESELRSPGRITDVADAAEAALQRTLPAITGPARGHWLALLALARWRSGDQCGMGLAAQEALVQGPHLNLVRLVDALAGHGMPYPAPTAHPTGAEAA